MHPSGGIGVALVVCLVGCALAYALRRAAPRRRDRARLARAALSRRSCSASAAFGLIIAQFASIALRPDERRLRQRLRRLARRLRPEPAAGPLLARDPAGAVAPPHTQEVAPDDGRHRGAVRAHAARGRRARGRALCDDRLRGPRLRPPLRGMSARPRLAPDQPLPETAPGPWLRLAALGAALATGARGGQRRAPPRARPPRARCHRAAAAGRDGPVAARLAHPRLLRPAAAALGLVSPTARSAGSWRSADAPAGRWGCTSRVAALAFAAALVAAAACYRGEPLPAGPWRDYVTLTKPRIMSLLLADRQPPACSPGRAACRTSASSPRCSPAVRSPPAARARSTTSSIATSTR